MGSISFRSWIAWRLVVYPVIVLAVFALCSVAVWLEERNGGKKYPSDVLNPVTQSGVNFVNEVYYLWLTPTSEEQSG